MNKDIIVPIVGIHLSGKSMSLSYLKRQGFIVENEIAEKIRIRDKRVAGANGEISFEKCVAKEEYQRDTQRNYGGKICFIESWHILTMAYMLSRGCTMEELKNYFKYVSEYEKENQLYCIYLWATPSVLKTRFSRLHLQNEYEYIYNFYKNLNCNIEVVLNRLKIRYFKINAMNTREMVCKELDLVIDKICERIKDE